MNILEALEKTLAVAQEMKKMGAKVRISMDNPDEEYFKEMEMDKPGPEDLPADKWCHVSFECNTQKQVDTLRAKESKLWAMGISFDTGSGFGARDWSIDWSFSYNPKESS